MKATQVYETVLYAGDPAAAAAFYERVLGLEVIERGELAAVLRCGSGVLLLFDPARSGQPGRPVPSHGAAGPGHVAFAAAAETLDGWRRHLAACGVAIEQEVTWDEAGTSIYFRDPAGNSVELAPPGLWKAP